MINTQRAEVDPASLMKLLASKDGTVREKARETLVALGKPAVSFLIDALQTATSDQLRCEAAKALGALVDAKSIPALVRALEDSEFDVAWLAGEALRQFNRRTWPPLLQALIESEGCSGSLRQGAHQVLVHQSEDGFHDVLTNLLKALQPGAAPESTVLAARQVLARTKEIK
jgi:HEAT repeat protein